MEAHMAKFTWNNGKIPPQRVDSCSHPLGIIPGKTQFYHRKLLLHSSLPQPDLETGCILHLFLNVGHTGHLLVSVAWERLQWCAEHPDSPKSTLLLAWGRVQCPADTPHCLAAGKDQHGVLQMAPEATSAPVSDKLKHVLNTFLN